MDNKGIQKGSSQKVLVVEDNQDNRELVAIEKARAENPDLILMDLFIPKIDGYEVTKRLKGDRDLKHIPIIAIPIIALTAHAMKGDMEVALAAGCDDYMPKPIDIKELPKQIKRFLKDNP